VMPFFGNYPKNKKTRPELFSPSHSSLEGCPLPHQGALSKILRASPFFVFACSVY